MTARIIQVDGKRDAAAGVHHNFRLALQGRRQAHRHARLGAGFCGAGDFLRLAIFFHLNALGEKPLQARGLLHLAG
jgi:hypothetical protein